VQNRATESKGASAGNAPKYVRQQKFAEKNQKINRETGENCRPLKKSKEEFTEKRNKKAIEENITKTPPNLLGMQRRIA